MIQDGLAWSHEHELQKHIQKMTAFHAKLNYLNNRLDQAIEESRKFLAMYEKGSEKEELQEFLAWLEKTELAGQV